MWSRKKKKKRFGNIHLEIGLENKEEECDVTISHDFKDGSEFG